MAKKKVTTTVVEEIVDDAPFTGTTHIGFVLDCSGSMFSVQDDVRGGFNAWLKDMQRDRSDEALMTMTVFNHEVEDRHVATPLDRVQALDDQLYAPGGNTALYDAVGHAIINIERKAARGDRIILAVYTDGLENSSREFTAARVVEMIKEREQRGDWTFTFLGAGVEAWAGNTRLRGAGMVTNTVRTRHDGVGTRDAFVALSGGIGQYRAQGAMNSPGLYSENAALGQVDASGAIDLTKAPEAPKAKASKPRATSKTS